MSTPEPESLALSREDASAISSYIKRRNTAVLTVMFTDIQGFTRITEERGEEYSRDLRREHDGIMREAIEGNGQGLIIKFIGDAVMAVFSEPSAGVDVALAIQARIRAFNLAHPQQDPLRVRIGLHMGQVAVEESLQTDVFGRHVNRAARIEALASGGQIYMSDPVFDSARGWLGSREGLTWVCHGRYAVKGIPKPVEIYEVCHAGHAKPAPPSGARRQRNLPRLAVAAALLGVGAALAAAVMLYQRTEVWLLPPYPDDLRLLNGDKVVLEGTAQDQRRRVAVALDAGPHVLRYDVADGVRYYAPIQVERGENLIQARYQESRLPAISVRSGVKEQSEDRAERSREFEFSYVDATGQRRQQRGSLQVRIQSSRAGDDPGRAVHRFSWRVARDGEPLREGELEAAHAIDDATYRAEPVAIIEEPEFVYHYRYYMLKEFAEFTLGAAFRSRRAGAGGAGQ